MFMTYINTIYAVADAGYSWLRRDIISTACRYKYRPCIDQAQADFDVYKDNPCLNRCAFDK